MLFGLGHRLQAQSLNDGQRWIVKFKAHTPFSQKAAIQSRIGARLIRSVPQGQFQLWSLPAGRAQLEELNALPEVAWAEPDPIYTATALPNDPELAQQWGLANPTLPGADIHAAEAWEITPGSAAVTVAVIDAGIDWTHPDLAENIWQNAGEDLDGDGVLVFVNGRWQFDPDDLNGQDDDGNGYPDDLIGWDFANHDNNPYDDTPHGHGTHVGGIIAARGNNALGISGVSWHSKLMPLKFLDQNSRGYLSDAIAALDYARSMGARVSNNSWGGYAHSQALEEALQRLEAADHILVAAAGNNQLNNDQYPLYPASLNSDHIVAVAASTEDDQLAPFSNYGPNTVDLAAPGVNIYSTLPNGSYGTSSGTSMAAPFVSGAVALLLSLDPNMPAAEVVAQLLNTTDQPGALIGKTTSSGRLNLAQALATSGQQTPGPACKTQARFKPRSSYTTCIGEEVMFINQSKQATQYSWHINGQQVSTQRVLNYAFPANGQYEVTLYASKGNCHSQVSKYIQVYTLEEPQLADVNICKSTARLSAGVEAAGYLWQGPDGSTLSTAPEVVVSQPGQYQLTLTDGCGQQLSRSLQVDLQGDCVWPGDVNLDGRVNGLDFLFLGLANGASGPPRSPAATAFEAQPAPANWQQSFPLNEWGIRVNYKHADCNGDGVVDLQDADVIRQNLSPDCGIYAGQQQGAFSLSLIPRQDSLLLGNKLMVDIALNTGGAPLTEVVGVAFSIEYDLPLQQGFQFGTEQSWLGTPTELGSLSLTPPLTGITACSQGAFVRTDQLSQSGEGVVGQGWITVDIHDIDTYSVLEGKASLSLRIKDAVLLKADGTVLPVSPPLAQQSRSIRLLLPPNKPAFTLTNVYPNPTTDLLNLEINAPFSSKTEIFVKNTLGETVFAHKYMLTNGKNVLKLKLPALPAGLYTCEAVGEGLYRQLHKFLIVR